MRTFDDAPLYWSAAGVGRVFNLRDSALFDQDSGTNDLPYNIEVTGEDRYRLTLAVAGFGRDELAIEAKANRLVIAGRRNANNEGKRYLHRGIAERNFERRFALPDHVKVTGATLDNGLLHVDLAREIPEAAKPRKIAIETPARPLAS